MNSKSGNAGNKDQGRYSAAEAQEAENLRSDNQKHHASETENEPEVIVTDKRRFTSEGEVIPLDGGAIENGSIESEQVSQEDLTIEQALDSAEIELLNAKLKESEDKRLEAERQVRDFGERFRQAQAQLRAETDEQRARLQRTFEQKLEAARGDVVAGLLDTLDNLKRAVTAAEKSDNRNSDFVSLLEGVRATAAMFEAKVLSMGLSAVPTIGQTFNPEVHEA